MAKSYSEKLVYSREMGLKVRHVTLRGTNIEIGEQIGRIARDRFLDNIRNIRNDPMLIRCQNAYMQKNYPEHYDRMKGAASALYPTKEDVGDYLSEIPYKKQQFGCSTIFFPRSSSTDGAAKLSRNYDFSIQDNSEPYIFEVYPEKGYSSLYVCEFDLLSGVLDGINSEGLTVAVLADDESLEAFPAEPTGGQHIGFHELQILRYLLDHCRNVTEAKEALLSQKLHYMGIPTHYIIGDRNGDSFVWENSYTTNRFSIIDGEGKPQVVTNFLLHRYASCESLPEESNVTGKYERYRTLQNELKKSTIYSTEDMKRILSSVFSHDKSDPSLTLWHSIYNTMDNSMEISFYDENNPAKRTSYFRFQLQ